MVLWKRLDPSLPSDSPPSPESREPVRDAKASSRWAVKHLTKSSVCEKGQAKEEETLSSMHEERRQGWDPLVSMGFQEYKAQENNRS